MSWSYIPRFLVVVVVLTALLVVTAGSALAEGPPTLRFIPCTEQSAVHSPVVGPNVVNPGANPPESRCPIGG